jgi:hypothetical protein
MRRRYPTDCLRAWGLARCARIGSLRYNSRLTRTMFSERLQPSFALTPLGSKLAAIRKTGPTPNWPNDAPHLPPSPARRAAAAFDGLTRGMKGAALYAPSSPVAMAAKDHLTRDTAVSIFTPLRCRLCRWKRQQAYQIDLKPNEYDGFLFPRKPLYVCLRCLPRYQTDARVMRVTRVLSDSEVAT